MNPETNSSLHNESKDKFTLNWNVEAEDFIRLDTSAISNYISFTTQINKIAHRGRTIATISSNSFITDSKVILNKQNIVAPLTGKLVKLDKDEIVIERCKHKMFFGANCTDCGELKDKAAKGSFLGISSGIKIAPCLAKTLENEILGKLKDNKKLILLLDIDNTILHSRTAPVTSREKSPSFKKDNKEVVIQNSAEVVSATPKQSENPEKIVDENLPNNLNQSMKQENNITDLNSKFPAKNSDSKDTSNPEMSGVKDFVIDSTASQRGAININVSFRPHLSEFLK